MMSKTITITLRRLSTNGFQLETSIFYNITEFILSGEVLYFKEPKSKTEFYFKDFIYFTITDTDKL